MDILTQGVVGAIVTQSLAFKPAHTPTSGDSPQVAFSPAQPTPRPSVPLAMVVGFLSGLPADADVLIGSPSDPLLTLEYHRQFTHSLLFIPVAGMLMALFLWPFLRRRIAFLPLLLFTTVGYGTSGLLDACTSYGVQLFWPFSDARIAWSIIAVVDPLFTLTLIVSLTLGWRRKDPLPGRMGLLFALAYLAMGAYLQGEARAVILENAQLQGRAVERLVVKPTLGNLVLWRGVSQSAGQYHVDAVRVAPFSNPRIHTGGVIGRLDLAQRTPPAPPPDSVAAEDVRRFAHLSDGYLVRHPEDPVVLGDIRYAMLPQALEPLWGVRLDPEEPDAHLAFETFRRGDRSLFRTFAAMLSSDWPGWRSVGEQTEMVRPTAPPPPSASTPHQ